MSELTTFVELGFRHITDVNALDHVLFLIALSAIYQLRDWRTALWVVSAFTVGHSVTLALAVTGAIRLPEPVIEFLIPVTIVAACAENIVIAHRMRTPRRGLYRPVLAGMFGLVHGAGFANYLRDLFVDRIAIPLFGFNIGIEAGQIVVITLAAALLAAADIGIEKLRRVGPASALRVRAFALSAVVMVVAVRWAVERTPW